MKTKELLKHFEAVVGNEAAYRLLERLAQEVGGCTIYIPTRPPYPAIDPTMTAKDISKRHQVSMKTAYRRLAERRKVKSDIPG